MNVSARSCFTAPGQASAVTAKVATEATPAETKETATPTPKDATSGLVQHRPRPR
jgi:hypothetical protein